LGNRWRTDGWAFTFGIGAGALNWKLSDVKEDNVYVDNESYTSAGAFISAGVCYMFSQHVGFSLNLQTLLGSLKDQYGWERKPAGVGGALGINFRF